MKKLLIIVMALALSGCGAIPSFTTQPTAGPTSTPLVIYQTVVVTVLVTAPATETPIPTATWTPIPTFTPQPTSATATTGTPGTGTPLATGTFGSPQYTATPSGTAGPGSPTATLPANAGGTLFTNLLRTGNHLYYSCAPSDITFSLSSTSPDVHEVDFFYRLEYLNSSLTTDWVDVAAMVPDNSGNFTFDFKASMIPSDLRRAAWVDYQFIGLNSSLKVIGRSAIIAQQVSFAPNCP